MKWILSRYEWDARKLAYVRSPVRLSWRGGVRLWLRTLLMGALFVGAGYPWWLQYFEKQAEAVNERLKQDLQAKRMIMGGLVVRLARLQERYNQFYAPLVNVALISPAEWEGAVGGSGIPRELEEALAYHLGILKRSYENLAQAMTLQAEALKRYPCLMPVQGSLCSGFGYRRDPFHGHWQMHTGVDISAPYGAPIRATAPGLIITAGWDYGGGYGIQVEIDHQNGYVTKYAHLSRVAVQAGDSVQRGDVIGYVGSTGYSVAPHLHYEVIYKGAKLDPRKYLLLL